MGSWLETCFLSELPIKCDQAVVCFILKKEAFKGNTIYHVDDFFSPISFALRGSYNEYGLMSSIKKDSASELTFKFFEKLHSEGQIKIKPEGSNIENTQKIESLSDLLTLVEHDRLYLKEQDYETDEPSLSLVYAHESLYDKILIETIKRETLGGHSLKRKLLEHIRVFKENLKLGLNFITLELVKHTNKDIRFVDFIQDSITNKYAVNPIIELAVFEQALYLSRKHWLVPLGKGSQSMEYCIPQIISNFVLETISGVIQEHAKYGDKDVDPLREIIF